MSKVSVKSDELKEKEIEVAVKSNKKISVNTFLQLEPQENYIAILMKKNYAMKVYTQAEWEKIANDIKNKKTK